MRPQLRQIHIRKTLTMIMIYSKLLMSCIGKAKYLHKVNKKTLKKLHESQLERDDLIVKLEEYVKLSDNLKLKNLAIEAEVKDLEYELEKSNAQLQQFSSRSKKLSHMQRLGATPGYRKGLGYNESNGASTSKTVFVPASIPIKNPEIKSSPKKVNKARTYHLTSC